MAQLRQDYQKFRERDSEVLVVGPEDNGAFRKYWEENQLPFPGLPDPDHQVLKMYGQQIKLFKLGRMPAQVIVDKSGMVRYAHYGHSMKDIPENADILSILDEINSGG